MEERQRKPLTKLTAVKIKKRIWGTGAHAPDFQQFHFSSLWTKYESQLSKYCVVCEIG